jgi:hypothetical protein
MLKRNFAPQTTLQDDSLVMGVSVAQWNDVLTTGFVQSLPKVTSLAKTAPSNETVQTVQTEQPGKSKGHAAA